MPELNAIGIVASDMATSIRFYRLLGPDVAVSPEECHLQAAGSRETGTRVSLACECASPADVDEVYARVTGGGFEGEREPWDAFWGQRYALLRDPDGVEVNLYAPL